MVDSTHPHPQDTPPADALRERYEVEFNKKLQRKPRITYELARVAVAVHQQWRDERLDAIRDRHSRTVVAPSNPLSPYMCGGCGETWPCPTIGILDDHGEGAGDAG